MDFTSRMTTLLGVMRRERNGAVADTMRYYGRPYGLNYGVSLPTLRRIAHAESPDHDFARYLFQQDVRELRLAALHIADPQRLTPDEFGAWAAGITSSEIAEEAAFALLSRAEVFPTLFYRWVSSPEPLLVYAALLGGARSSSLERTWIVPALDAVRHHAYATGYAPQLVARGAVAMLAALGAQNEENRQAVLRAADSPSGVLTVDFVYEELAWRLET